MNESFRSLSSMSNRIESIFNTGKIEEYHRLKEEQDRNDIIIRSFKRKADFNKDMQEQDAKLPKKTLKRRRRIIAASFYFLTVFIAFFWLFQLLNTYGYINLFGES